MRTGLWSDSSQAAGRLVQCVRQLVADHRNDPLVTPCDDQAEMGNPDHERKVFGAFLELAPGFAGESVQKWQSASIDPPDIECTTGTGDKVGVELKELVLQKGIEAHKPRRIFIESLRKALVDLPDNPMQNIALLTYLPNKGVSRIRPVDVEGFHQQALESALDLDAKWDDKWNGRQPHPTSTNDKDFKKSYPILAKYVGEILALARFDRFGVEQPTRSGEYWIASRMKPDTYDLTWVSNRLVELLDDTVAKYDGFDSSYKEVSLLIHADDNALLYNPPWTQDGHVRKGEEFLREHGPGAFAKVFLFVWIHGEEQVDRLYPPPPSSVLPT